MPAIVDTIRQLQARKPFPVDGQGGSSRLRRLPAFGSDPGSLNGWCYVPEAKGDLPLVVVLHGCTQSAAGYDHGSGWSDLAERFGFAVLFPEQQRANNANLCFNWFLEEDTRRDGGEALSIRQMIAAMTARYPIDAGQVFVTGLSAGGAMAGVMLATYPELFAGGSIIAGLPFGAATSVSAALQRMRGAGHITAPAYAAIVRRASTHERPWPAIAIWHGDADRTVDIANADAIVGQWLAVQGIDHAPDRIDLVDGQRHRLWLGRDGRPAVEDYRIAGLGHGTPLKTRGADGCGNAGAYMLEAGISSTWRQAASWGLVGMPTSASAVPAPASSMPDPVIVPSMAAPDAGPDTLVAGVSATIERALRSAGLMR